jgi:hypothetical protein
VIPCKLFFCFAPSPPSRTALDGKPSKAKPGGLPVADENPLPAHVRHSYLLNIWRAASAKIRLCAKPDSNTVQL